MTMKMFAVRMHTLVACLLWLASALPARAQGAYVGASLTGDLTRYSGSQSEGVPDMSRGGEAIGFALRVGTPLGSMWGVEAEFARPAEIETEWTPGFVPLSQTSGVWSSIGDYPVSGVYPVDFDIITRQIYSPAIYRVQTRQRNTTLSTGLWARQDLSARVSLTYLGGAGFGRTETETEYHVQAFSGYRFDASSLLRAPSSIRTIAYGVRPFVGIESRIAMTDHLQLVPGMRLHALEGGWLLRPSVGLAWAF